MLTYNDSRKDLHRLCQIPKNCQCKLDLVSRLRIETFRDRCHVAVGLTVPLFLCFGHKLGVITQSHSQSFLTQLGTVDVIVGLRVFAAAQLEDLLHSLSATLLSD